MPPNAEIYSIWELRVRNFLRKTGISQQRFLEMPYFRLFLLMGTKTPNCHTIPEGLSYTYIYIYISIYLFIYLSMMLDWSGVYISAYFILNMPPPPPNPDNFFWHLAFFVSSIFLLILVCCFQTEQHQTVTALILFNPPFFLASTNSSAKWNTKSAKNRRKV